ncbi:GGDEF domain-containing protein [Devosia sp. XJ19-1]|uniref:diguanylate cyclase n=1 Tax=Devosia ureilytica TaxID=2952754 RepID=A0A9Q4AQU3_9HYPH|nr:GGDEF domain-containing protein [Devosia ureilytica]MCP8884525.1 GGDEF domain-containing protein [Devosia ureilytica]MCP8888155.1 GGDEF domain-containing protein [Devosia ureilytica]
MSPRAPTLQGWSSVGRWTLFGTMACVAASISFTLIVFGDLGGELATRLLISAAALPIMIGAPLFFYFSVRMRGLAIANARLGRVARTDSLTACLNRGAFTSRIDAWLRDPASSNCGALLMVDADNFKAINDLYGHDLGDEALTIIARAIRSTLRNGDLVGRMGGEEFAVFLPGVTQHQAQVVAERIRVSVNTAEFSPHGEARRLSVSVGGAAFSQTTSFAQLFRIADQRLYGAKHAGRNIAAVVQVEDHPSINIRRTA